MQSPKRSPVEQIFTFRQLVEKAKEFRKKAYIAIVDFKAAIESVNRKCLLIIVCSLGLPGKYCLLLEKLYEENESCIPVNRKRCSSFTIKTGVRRGCR